MKINKLIEKLIIGLLVISFNACSGDMFEDTLTNDDNASDINMEEYAELVQSSEFKEYSSKYVGLETVVDDLTSKMSNEEKNDFLNVANLYLSDPERYQALFEYQTAQLIANDNSHDVRKKYVSLLEAKESLVNNEHLYSLIKKDNILIKEELQKGLGLERDKLSPVIKTRTEGGKFGQCVSLCRSQYDNDIYYANLAYGCASAVNIGFCLASAGTSIGGNIWTQMGLIAAVNIARQQARSDYDNCVANCRLSYT